MARQPRIVLPGQLHLVRQRGHDGQPIVRDAQDVEHWRHALHDVAITRRVEVHGFALFANEYRLLAVPPDAQALARLLQDLGRRYVGGFNARHGRSGTLWDGRFRSALVQPGAWELVALAYVEAAAEPLASSAPHHLGQQAERWLVDPAAYWALGNTPFERHVAWRSRLEQGLAPGLVATVERALRSGRPIGSPDWLAALQPRVASPLFPRPRGRPRKALESPAPGPAVSR